LIETAREETREPFSFDGDEPRSAGRLAGDARQGLSFDFTEIPYAPVLAGLK
jgi:hypothetical protein